MVGMTLIAASFQSLYCIFYGPDNKSLKAVQNRASQSVDSHPILTHQLHGKVNHQYNLKSLDVPPSQRPEVGDNIQQILTIIGSNFSAIKHPCITD